MRVLVASDTWYPARNGVNRFATEVARKLVARSHDTPVLAPQVADIPTEERHDSLAIPCIIRRGRIHLTIEDVLETTAPSGGHGTFARFGWETVVPQWKQALSETVESAGRAGRSAST